MSAARRLRPVLVPLVAFTVAGVVLVLSGPKAGPATIEAAAVLPVHPALHHVIDPTPTPAPPPAIPVPAAAPVQLGAPAASGASSRSSAPPAPRPAPVQGAFAQQALINADRAAAGLPALRWSSCLASVAAQNAARMAAQGYISHANGVSLDLGCRLGLSAGENVGYTSAGINDGQLNQLFMNSPEHRANILGPYHFVGAAWAIAPNGYAYLAVEFG